MNAMAIFTDCDLYQWSVKHADIKPVFRSKKEATICWAADLIAWKNRTTMKSSDWHKALKDPVARNSYFDSVFDSLLHVSVRPRSGIVFEDELIDACKKEGVPKL